MVNWVVGAAINLIGSIAINLGTNVMKLGHNKRAQLDVPDDQKPPVSRFREWQIGTVFFIVGNIANFVSFGYAAQSLLAALGSVQFVSNVFFAAFVLKEKVTMLVLVATGCIIGGCMLLVIFGNHTSEDYTVDQLLDLYRNAAYIVYLVMMFVFVAGSYIAYLHGKTVSGQKGRERSMWVSILPVAYSVFSALLGTQSVLFSKSLSVLLRTTFSGHSQLGNWYTWVTLVCFLITAGFWVTRLNKGLRLFPAMIIVPLMQICWTLFSIISGMIYFEEYTSFGPSTAQYGVLNAIMFAMGVLIVFVGVFLLTKSGQRKQEDYQDLDQQINKEGMELVVPPALDASGGEDKGPGSPGGLADTLRSRPGTAGGALDTSRKDAKIYLDTLRVTSLASNTLVINKNATRTKTNPGRGDTGGGDGGGSMSPRSGAGGDLSGLATTHPLHSTISSEGPGAHLPAIADSEHSEAAGLNSTQRMMGTIKKGAKSISRNLRKDFNVDLEDFKQMLGMGQGGYMPALSLFSVPAVDLTASTRQKPEPTGRAAMLSSLPKSRFYTGEDVESGLEQMRSEDLDRPHAPLMAGLATSSGPWDEGQRLLASADTSPYDAFQQTSPGPLRPIDGGAASAPGTVGEVGRIKSLVGKTMKQVEGAATRAKYQVEASIERLKDTQAGAAYEPIRQPSDELGVGGSSESRLGGRGSVLRAPESLGVLNDQPTGQPGMPAVSLALTPAGLGAGGWRSGHLPQNETEGPAAAGGPTPARGSGPYVATINPEYLARPK